ncbi:MAG: molecular chaperone HtpG [Verrucomicrobia bacterium]|nr:molecular chaperone HtpG [Verrucomicrobiota bacterium]
MAKQNKAFKTEVQQLLDLVIHSLYTKKEIYLRELLSNASDAIDRARYEGLTDASILADDADFRIKIAADKTARTITITDNGIGMNREEVEANIGTIASSGTKKFLASLGDAGTRGGDKAEFIGQFGVGFYSAFMVADRVSVITLRRGGKHPAVAWTSEGTGEYEMDDAEKATPGTQITLHLREGMDEYLDEWKIKDTVKQYSDYIGYPIRMDVTHKEYPKKDGKTDYSGTPTETVIEETLNSMKAIWRRTKAEVTKEEHTEFYRHISHDHGDPVETIHYAAEGATEFRALLYIPGKAPMDMFMPNRRKGVHLYVKNVFITDDCKELLPDYLRFVRGVVDSSDLPLNISREMLQDDAILRRIRKSLTGKILSVLAEMKDKRAEDYSAFWAEFGRVVKEGIHFDHDNGEKIKDLLMFPSSRCEAGKQVSLRDYVARMPAGQTDIYYITGEKLANLAGSPHLEAFKKKDYEVLFYADPIDEWVAQGLYEYDKKPFKAIDRGDINIDSDDEKKESEKIREEAGKSFKDLLAKIKDTLKDQVAEVRFSSRLTDSACCLVADEHGMNPNMERIMRAMGQEPPPVKRILELNPKHPVLATMQGMFEKDKDAAALSDYSFLLFDQALLAEGSEVKDPRRFAQLVSKLMVGAGATSGVSGKG